MRRICCVPYYLLVFLLVVPVIGSAKPQQKLKKITSEGVFTVNDASNHTYSCTTIKGKKVVVIKKGAHS